VAPRSLSLSDDEAEHQRTGRNQGERAASRRRCEHQLSSDVAGRGSELARL